MTARDYSGLPPPPVTRDVDVRGLDGFIINIARMRGSVLWASTSGDGFKAWFGLAMQAFFEKPAGSLPDDERLLAYWSGIGPKWRKVRDEALHGYTLCADGRWHHAVISEDVIKAAERRAEYRAQREAENERLKNWRAAKKGKRETPSETVSSNVSNGVSSNVSAAFRNCFETSRKGREGNPSSISNEIAAAGRAREARPAADAAEKINDLNGFHFLDGIAGRWNQRAQNYGSPEVLELTDRRAKQTRAMLDAVREHGFTSDDAAFGFILGKLDESFFSHNPKRPLTFDQLVSENFWPQLIEGAFDYRPKKRGRP